VTQYFEMPCPHCRRGLRIRTTYVGRRLLCKYCKHDFRVAGEKPAAAAAVPDAEAPPAPAAAEAEALRRRVAELEQDLDRAHGESAVAASEHARGRERIEALESQLAAANRAGLAAAELRRQLDAVREERDQLHEHVGSHTQRAARMEGDLQAVSAEVVALEAALRDAEEAGRRRGEAAQEQLDAERAEKERAAAEWKAESEAAARLRGQVEDLQRSLAEAVQAHEEGRRASTQAFREARGVWEAERAGLRAKWEEEVRAEFLAAEKAKWEEENRAELRAAEQRLLEERARAAAEAEAARQQIDVLRQERDAAVQRLQAAGGERGAADGRNDAARGPDEVARLADELDRTRKEKDAAARKGGELAARVQALQGEVARLRQAEADYQRSLAVMHGFGPGRPPAGPAADPQRDKLQDELEQARRELASLKNVLHSMGIIV
jgi:chromosome segregation ATPase